MRTGNGQRAVRLQAPTRAPEPAPSSVGAADAWLWTVEDLCRHLGFSRRWVHERTRRGEIPCYRLGMALRFDPEEIRRWVAQYHSDATTSEESR